ncbi:MAG: hypothetical protein IT318_22090 [Anaerolineales bacterium]|nr:hypothetical protein [Anaerolineales bacterium]
MPSPAPPGPGRPPARGLGFALQLSLLVFLPLAAIAVVVPLVSLRLHAQAMRVLVAGRDRRAVQAAAASLQQQLEHQARAVQGLALYAAAVTPQAALADHGGWLREFDRGLAFLDQAGKLLAASGEAESWAGRPMAGLLAQLGQSTTPLFSEAFVDPATGRVTLLAAARANGGPVAVGGFEPGLLAGAGLGTLAQPGSGASVWVVDGRGQVLVQAGPPAPEGDLAAHAGVAEALRGETGEAHLTVDGEEHVVAYSPVEPVGWALVMEEPWHSVDSPLLRSTLAAPLVLIPVVLVALLALAFGIRQIVQPLRRLALSAGELGLGHFEAVEAAAGGIAEIQHLQAELVHMARQVRAAQQSLRGYVAAVTRGQEDERRRLARELHDGPVQALIALDQRVQMVQLKLKGTAPEVHERLAELRQMTGGLLEDVRRVIRALRPIYLEDLGLLPALEMLARDLDSTAGIPAAFRSQGAPTRLAAEREIAAYRFAQAALNNIARHSQATRAEVTALFEPELFTLRVQDNGRGFTPPQRLGDLAAAGHFGLVGMQERAELAAGRMSIRSAPGQGATVELRLPLRPPVWAARP